MSRDNFMINGEVEIYGITQARNRTIYKYPLLVCGGAQSVAIPMGAELLTVQLQHGEPVLWAMVEPEAPKVMRHVQMYGTGWPIGVNDELIKFLGTVQCNGDILVWHFFEVHV